MTNITVDFTTVTQATDPLGAGFVCSEFGGNPVPLVGDGTWNARLKALAPGHVRASVAWYGGSPGYGAGGSSRAHNTAAALVQAIKGIGAIPLISYNGDTSDNGGLTPANGAALVHYFNDNGGQNNGPVKYWSVGNEPEVSGPTPSYGTIIPAMHGADTTTVVGAPAAAYWDTNLLQSVTGISPLGGLSWHEYDGGNNNGTGYPTDPQYAQHVASAKGFRAGVLYGVEEMNWAPGFNWPNTNLATTAFYDYHNTLFLADAIGQLLSTGAHATVYADSNGALGLMNDGAGNNNQPGSKYTTFPSYWALGIWTGMNGQFKRYSGNFVSASTTFGFSSLAVYATDNGKIVVINKTSSTQALSIAMTLAGGVTAGTYTVSITNAGSPLSAITQVVTNANFTGSTITYSIPANTAASIDVTPAAAPPAQVQVPNVVGMTLAAADAAIQAAGLVPINAGGSGNVTSTTPAAGTLVTAGSSVTVTQGTGPPPPPPPPPPGPHTLAISVAAKAGTDAFGNAYRAGVSVYNKNSGLIAQLNDGSLLAGPQAALTGTGGASPAGVEASSAGALDVFSGAASSSDNEALIELLSQSNSSPYNSPLMQLNQPIVLLVAAPTAAPGAVVLYADGNSTPRVINGIDGNVYGFGYKITFGDSGQLINSTSPVIISGMQFTMATGVDYHITGWVNYQGAGAAGFPQFGFDGSAAAHIDGDNSFTTPGAPAVIDAGIFTATAGLQSGPALTGGHQLYKFELWAGCTAGGVFNVRAQLGSAGNNFTINAGYLRVETFP